MDVKKVLYGTGMAGAMAGAFLAGSIALQPVFAQNTGTPPTTTQPNAQSTTGETADAAGEKAEPNGQAEKAEGNGQAEKPEAAGPNEAAEATALQAKATVSLDQAKQTALGQFPGGSVQAAALDSENGTVVYEIDVVNAAGAHHDVKVDATTGAITAAAVNAENDTGGEGAD